MKSTLSVVLLSMLTACAPAPGPRTPTPSPASPGVALPSAHDLVLLHERHVEPAITTRRFSHEQLWNAIGPLIDSSTTLDRTIIGHSAEGRSLYAVTHGTGPVRVLLWSQMHGDETTATMTLADIFRFLAAEPDHPLARRLRERLTIVAIPMLNTDGAQRFQRRNAYGVDINRDASALATPEGRVLKAVQETFDPDFGFNLHDQSVRTRVGGSDRLAAIALLAPAFDQDRSMNDVRSRAVQVAAAIRSAIEPLVGGHIARYDDSFNPRAFGDLMQTWGVSTILVESGGWTADPEKQFLRRVNFVGLLAALDAIGSGAFASADPAEYHSLPPNGSSVSDLLVRGGTVVIPGLQPARIDLAINYEDPLARAGGRVNDIGDLSYVSARDTIDADGLFIHPAPTMLTESAGRPILRTGEIASFTLRASPDPLSEVIVRVVEGLVDQESP